MKVHTQVACLTLIVAVLLVGCGGTAATPEVVDTVVVPPESPTSPPPSATQPPPSPTTQPPTETHSPPTPTLPPPTDNPLPTEALETPVSSPVPTLANLPVEGVWTGGGTNLLLSFNIQNRDGEATLSDVGILWEGEGGYIIPTAVDGDEIEPYYIDCEVNTHLEVLVPVDENGFEMNYHTDEFSIVLSGIPKSNTVIEGVLNLKVEDCGSHQVSWRAVPKASPSSSP